MNSIRRASFKEAMSSFPSGVTLVTTTDESGQWRGFTATSFCSVSMEPPLVLVCLAVTAECHPAFMASDDWIINIIHRDHEDLAIRFATRGADKFGSGDFVADEGGLPLLGDACVALRCRAHARHDGGDHTILIGRVEETRMESAKLRRSTSGGPSTSCKKAHDPRSRGFSNCRRGAKGPRSEGVSSILVADVAP